MHWRLIHDPFGIQAKFRKAEALYAQGDFEMSLVYYHRGHLLRPEMDDFRLGIQKAREAINNSIGSKLTWTHSSICTRRPNQ